MSENRQQNKRRHGETQGLILAFIREQIAQNGYPPSVREICEAVGLKSTSTVHGHLKRLEKQGILKRDSMKPRAMAVMGKPRKDRREHVRMVPLLGPVAAGIPILAEESISEMLPIPEFMLRDGEHFALLVRGDSMIKAGILNGDYLVVKQQQQALNGEIVVAMVNGDATVKRFYKEKGQFRLQPENDAMQPLYVKEVEILGKVVSVYRAL
ncbi:MAG: transcriptional repressor LexA [Clostridiales bacterium]|nr:transcriptional repressor LexA [Clostridiales bacterium]